MYHFFRQWMGWRGPFRTGFLALAIGSGLLVPGRAHSLPGGGGSSRLDRFQAMPLLFEEAGGGQFTCRAPGFALRVGPGEARMLLWPAPPGGMAGGDGASGGELVFQWQETNAEPTADAEGAAPTRLNYFIGRDPEGWRTNVAAYQRVRYRELYPGIDVVYYGNDRQLEYDLWVRPGVDPTVARFCVQGAEKVEVSAEGDLLIGVAGGEVRQRRPVAFQRDGSQTELVEVSYAVQPGAPPTVGFEVGEYDRDRVLVIDPVLLYAAYYGGSGYDLCRRLLVTSAGKLVVAGETTSTNLPVHRPLFETTVVLVTNTFPGGIEYVTEVALTNINGSVNAGGPGVEVGNPLGNEAFLAGFSADGRELEFATYLGGGAIDAALDVVEDAEGNLVVFGLTQSPDFPVKSSLAWSGVAYTRMDEAGTAETGSGMSGLVVTTNAWPIPDGWTAVWKTNISGTSFWGYYPFDAFLSVLSAWGDQLLFSSYLGEDGSDQGMRMETGDQGWFHLISAQGVSQQSLGQPMVLGLRSNELIYVASPLAGFPVDALPLAAVAAPGGGLWVAGEARPRSNQEVQTWQTTYGCLVPLTASNATPFQCGLGGGQSDAFLMRLDSLGRADYFTLLGGQGADVAMGLALAADGVVTVAGYTTSTNFPVRAALKPTNATGLRDGFVMQLDATLTNLVFGTYLGQDQWLDSIQALRVGPDDTLLVAGWTDSPYSQFDAAAATAYWNAVTNASQPVPGLRGINGWLVGLAADGSRVVDGGILGGDGDDQIWDVGLGQDGTVWVAGQTHGFGAHYGDLVSTNWWREPDPAVRQSAVWRKPAGFLAQLYQGAAELAVTRSEEGLPKVSWPAIWAGYDLFSSAGVGGTEVWTNRVDTELSGTNRVHTVTDPALLEFFRLQGP